MTTLTSLRRRVFVLAALAMVAGLIVPVVPASAASEACPSTIPSAGYRDLAGLGSEAIEAINCIAYYGIAQGVTSTQFDPAGTVPRWQMALFLVRTAEDLGITLPAGSNQGYTDLGGVPGEAVTAINQLTQLGITRGVGPGRFGPYEAVPRWQMAMFLTRLYAKVGYDLPSGTVGGFTDIGVLPIEAQYAINQLAQLGITRGIDAKHFGPHGFVYRWQMAIFLARQLQACYARPLVVTVTPDVSTAPTWSTVMLTVRVRHMDGTGVPNRYVDVFVGSLDSAKQCRLDSDAHLNNGDAGTGTNCRIDTGDPKTDSSGVATVTFTHSGVIETDTVYAWIGDDGQTFDADIVRSYGTASVQWTVSGVVGMLRVDDVSAPFGTQVQVKARLLTSSGLPVYVSGERVVFKVTRGSSPIINTYVVTASDGVATLVYTGPADPSGGDDLITDNVVAFWDKDRDGVDDGLAEYDDTAKVFWDEMLPREDEAVLSQSTDSSLAGQPVTLTATVTDRYGAAISNARVWFLVTDGSTTNLHDDTDSSGVADVTWTPSASDVYTIDAWIDFDRDGNFDSIDIDYGDVTDLTHYVVATAPDLAGEHVFDLLGVDGASNTVDVIELSTANLYRLSYDATLDEFTVDTDEATLGEFETALAALDLPEVDGAGKVELRTVDYTTVTSGASTFHLETS